MTPLGKSLGRKGENNLGGQHSRCQRLCQSQHHQQPPHQDLELVLRPSRYREQHSGREMDPASAISGIEGPEAIVEGLWLWHGHQLIAVQSVWSSPWGWRAGDGGTEARLCAGRGEGGLRNGANCSAATHRLRSQLGGNRIIRLGKLCRSSPITVCGDHVAMWLIDNF